MYSLTTTTSPTHTLSATKIAKWGGCPYLHLYQEGPLGWSTLGGLYVIAWSTLVKNQESLCGIWNQSGPRFHCTGYRYFQSVPSKVYPPNLPYFSIFTKPFPSVPSSSIVLLRQYLPNAGIFLYGPPSLIFFSYVFCRSTIRFSDAREGTE